MQQHQETGSGLWLYILLNTSCLQSVSLIPLINDCVDCLVVKTGFAHENQCRSFGRRFQHVLLFLYIHFKGLTNITLEKPLYFKLCIWL